MNVYVHETYEDDMFVSAGLITDAMEICYIANTEKVDVIELLLRDPSLLFTKIESHFMIGNNKQQCAGFAPGKEKCYKFVLDWFSYLVEKYDAQIDFIWIKDHLDSEPFLNKEILHYLDNDTSDYPAHITFSIREVFQNGFRNSTFGFVESSMPVFAKDLRIASVNAAFSSKNRSCLIRSKDFELKLTKSLLQKISNMI